MDRLRVALLQIPPRGADVEANLREGLEHCRRAAGPGMAIGVTYLERTGSGAPRNGLALVDRDERDVLHYLRSREIERDARRRPDLYGPLAETGGRSVLEEPGP